MLTIRQATPDDAPSIWAMHQDNWELFRTDYDESEYDPQIIQPLLLLGRAWVVCDGLYPIACIYLTDAFSDIFATFHFVCRRNYLKRIIRSDVFTDIGKLCFDTGVNKLKACILSTQSVARKLLERNNFRRVGTMKEDTMKDGKPVDVILYELTRKRFYDGQK